MAKPSSPAKAATPTDWEAIERAYRAGLMSIREIAKQHSISDKAIRNKAKDKAWERDLTAKVQEGVRAALVRAESAPADTEQEIINEQVDIVVGVVKIHRKRITRQTDLVDLLTEQLVSVAGKREDFEDEIEDMTADDRTGERRARLMKAIALPTHASTAVNLANALKTLIGLERQAYSIKDESERPVDALAMLLGRVNGTALPVCPAVGEDDDE